MDVNEAITEVERLKRLGVPEQDITVEQPYPTFSERWDVSAVLQAPLELPLTDD